MKLTDSTQVVAGPTVKAADGQVDKPPPAVKSRPGAPIVSTSTVATVPVACAVTVTLCELELTPTGCGVPKTPFNAHAPGPANRKAVRATALQPGLREAVNPLRNLNPPRNLNLPRQRPLPSEPLRPSLPTRIVAAGWAGVHG